MVLFKNFAYSQCNKTTLFLLKITILSRSWIIVKFKISMMWPLITDQFNCFSAIDREIFWPRFSSLRSIFDFPPRFNRNSNPLHEINSAPFALFPFIEFVQEKVYCCKPLFHCVSNRYRLYIVEIRVIL